jgi:hypothetical protein
MQPMKSKWPVFKGLSDRGAEGLPSGIWTPVQETNRRGIAGSCAGQWPAISGQRARRAAGFDGQAQDTAHVSPSRRQKYMEERKKNSQRLYFRGRGGDFRGDYRPAPELKKRS